SPLWTRKGMTTASPGRHRRRKPPLVLRRRRRRSGSQPPFPRTRTTKLLPGQRKRCKESPRRRSRPRRKCRCPLTRTLTKTQPMPQPGHKADATFHPNGARPNQTNLHNEMEESQVSQNMKPAYGPLAAQINDLPEQTYGIATSNMERLVQANTTGFPSVQIHIV